MLNCTENFNQSHKKHWGTFKKKIVQEEAWEAREKNKLR